MLEAITGDAERTSRDEVCRIAEMLQSGAAAMTVPPACPDPQGFATNELDGRLSESHRPEDAPKPVDREEPPLSPEEEWMRAWREQYDRVVPQAANMAYDHCLFLVEDTGEFPDFDTVFDDVDYAMTNVPIMRGTGWMLGTGIGFGYARAIVACMGRCDVSAGVRAIAEYMGFDGDDELRELGLAP
jgi:hypothetical protein